MPPKQRASELSSHPAKQRKVAAAPAIAEKESKAQRKPVTEDDYVMEAQQLLKLRVLRGQNGGNIHDFAGRWVCMIAVRS